MPRMTYERCYYCQVSMRGIRGSVCDTCKVERKMTNQVSRPDETNVFVPLSQKKELMEMAPDVICPVQMGKVIDLIARGL